MKVTELSYVPAAEFVRLLKSELPARTKTEIFAALCRINVLYMIARAGSGHIGSSFSSIDIVSWLFLNELNLAGEALPESEADVYFSSKGHDVPAKYAVLLAKGLLEFDKIHTLRRLGGLPGHPDVSIPFMHTNTGSLGMGISKARGMALARRLRKARGHFYVLTGDGELQEGQFWESLQPTANRQLGELSVIIDHNKLQSDTEVAQTSDLGDLERKLSSFGWFVRRCDGHDFEQLDKAFREFEKVKNQPKILIADTIKGKGVSFMEPGSMKEGELYRFHSGAPSDGDYERALAELVQDANRKLQQAKLIEVALEKQPHPGRKSVDGFQRMVPAYSQALIKAAAKHPNLVALDADLVLDTGLIPFREKYPERFFECGIAEQDMVSQAGGMALEGALPVVHSFACFLSDRPNEQIFNNATEGTKIIYVGSLAGLLPAGPGHSHQCVRDISALAAVPNLLLIEPGCEAEVTQTVDYLVNKTQESSYLRLCSIPVQVPFSLSAKYKLEFGKGTELTEGDDALLITYGPVMLAEAYKASLLLRERNFGLKVVNLPWLNRVDVNWLHELVREQRILVTLDNHFLKGGQGEFVLSEIAKIRTSRLQKVLPIGLTEIPVCGQNDEALRAHGFDAASLADTVFSLAEELAAAAGAQ